MKLLFIFFILILQVAFIFKVVTSDKEIGSKILWSLVLIFIPLIGIIAYLLLGDSGSSDVAPS